MLGDCLSPSTLQPFDCLPMETDCRLLRTWIESLDYLLMPDDCLVGLLIDGLDCFLLLLDCIQDRLSCSVIVVSLLCLTANFLLLLEKVNSHRQTDNKYCQ